MFKFVTCADIDGNLDALDQLVWAMFWWSCGRAGWIILNNFLNAGDGRNPDGTLNMAEKDVYPERSIMDDVFLLPRETYGETYYKEEKARLEWEASLEQVNSVLDPLVINLDNIDFNLIFFFIIFFFIFVLISIFFEKTTTFIVSDELSVLSV